MSMVYDIKKYSPTQLRFERKINIRSSNKKIDYEFKVSDIHFEIDMALLGCHAKLLFNDIYYHILDILAARNNGSGIIVCKNFDHIHSELLEIFHSYMQTLKHQNLNIVYILVTENVSFIPRSILNRSQIISFKRPTKGEYIQATSKTLLGDRNIKNITNIKNIKGKITQIDNINKLICDKLLNKILNSLYMYSVFCTVRFYEIRLYRYTHTG